MSSYTAQTPSFCHALLSSCSLAWHRSSTPTAGSWPWNISFLLGASSPSHSLLWHQFFSKLSVKINSLGLDFSVPRCSRIIGEGDGEMKPKCNFRQRSEFYKSAKQSFCCKQFSRRMSGTKCMSVAPNDWERITKKTFRTPSKKKNSLKQLSGYNVCMFTFNLKHWLWYP